MPDLEMTTLGEQAYRKMRQMIVVGELPAGKWLRKRAMASKLQMSATPILEAIRRLEFEGLVQTEPQWGSRVRIFTVPEIYELANMRVVLEGFVARACAERLSQDQIAALMQVARRVDQIDLEFEDPQIAKARGQGAPATEDAAFHLALAKEARLPLVHRELERLQVLKATCRMYLVPPAPTTITHEHIMQVIASRDGQQAERVMREHIQASTDAFIPSLRQRFGDGPVGTVDSADGAED
jgi:GntR family transcriptional regulator of vanillate catabolism